MIARILCSVFGHAWGRARPFDRNRVCRRCGLTDWTESWA